MLEPFSRHVAAFQLVVHNPCPSKMAIAKIWLGPRLPPTWRTTGCPRVCLVYVLKHIPSPDAITKVSVSVLGASHLASTGSCRSYSFFVNQKPSIESMSNATDRQASSSISTKRAQGWSATCFRLRSSSFSTMTSIESACEVASASFRLHPFDRHGCPSSVRQSDIAERLI